MGTIMRLSYSFSGKKALDSISIPLDARRVVLLTGTENFSLRLLGGIIAGLFPITELSRVAQVRALMRPYQGQFDLEAGEIPTSAAYVGNDPDHHLLFAKVWEECVVRDLDITEAKKALLDFGLDAHFLRRRIASLSGGEKIRVSLANAFAVPRDCYVLHGVVPWLDTRGRKALARAIQKVKESSSTIVLLEQEPHDLAPLIDSVMWFDGKTAQGIDREAFFSQPVLSTEVSAAAAVLRHKLASFEGTCSNPVLTFGDISLHSVPGCHARRATPLLKSVSFTLDQAKLIALIGENGAGKSTIAQMMMRVVRPQAGEIRLCGSPLDFIAREFITKTVSYVGQFPEKQITLSTVEQYRQRARIQGNTLALSLLNRYLAVGNGPVSTLTALEEKLLCLAISVTPHTKLVILDEPTWGLDSKGLILLLNALCDIADAIHPAFFMISHNRDLVEALGARTYLLQDGHIALAEPRSGRSESTDAT